MSSRIKKGKSSRDLYYPTQWSDWEWNEEWKCRERYRLKCEDEYEFEYEQPPMLAPRPQPAIPTQDYTSERSNPYSASDLSTTAPWTVACTHPTCLLSFRNKEERDRHYQTTHANSGDRPHRCDVPGCQAGVQSWDRADKLRAHNKQWHGPYHCLESGCVHGYPNGFGSQVDLDAHLRTAHGALNTSLHALTQSVSEAATHVATQYSFISTEKFDANYKVHHENRFKWGLVFKALWAEPRGETSNQSQITESTSSEIVGSDRHGQQVFAKGTTKSGVHAKHHAVIYTDTPAIFEGENLKLKPIRMNPDTARQKLDKASRLNYAKTYTVEYNVKVWFIGKIASESEERLAADYNLVNPPMPVPGSTGKPVSNDVYGYSARGTSNYAQGAGSSSGTNGSQGVASPYYSGSGTAGYYSEEVISSPYTQGVGAYNSAAASSSSTTAYSPMRGSSSYGPATSSTSRPSNQNNCSNARDTMPYIQNTTSGGYDQSSSGSYYSAPIAGSYPPPYYSATPFAFVSGSAAYGQAVPSSTTSRPTYDQSQKSGTTAQTESNAEEDVN